MNEEERRQWYKSHIAQYGLNETLRLWHELIETETPSIPKFMLENEQWYCEQWCGKNYYYLIHNAFTYARYRLVMPILRARYPYYPLMRNRERIRKELEILKELESRSSDGCFDLPEWLAKATDVSPFANTKCKHCGKIGFLHSFGQLRLICYQCNRTMNRPKGD